MNAKQHYTIVFTNDLSYEDKEYKNYEAKQWQRVARVIKIEELFYYFG